MKFYWILTLFVIVFSCIHCSAQSQSQSEEDFYTRAVRGESVYYEEDKTMRLPIIHRPSRVKSHIEILWEKDSDQGYYFAEYNFGNGSGSRLICKCSEAEMVTFLQSQSKASRNLKKGSFSFSINSQDMKFQSEKCLYETIFTNPIRSAPIIKSILSSEIFTSSSKILDIDMNSEFVIKRGQGIIYFESDIPSGYNIVSLGKKHKLKSITQKDRPIIYPPASADEWKKNLISNGYFTTQILPSSDNWADVSHFSNHKYLDQKNKLGFVLNIAQSHKNLKSNIQVDAEVEMLVDRGKDTIVQMQVSNCFDCTMSLTMSNGVVKISEKGMNSNRGSFTTNAKPQWKNISLHKFNIKTKKMSDLVNIDRSDKDLSIDFEIKENEGLYIRTKVPVPESMYIPIDIDVPQTEYNVDKDTNTIRLRNYKFRKSNNKLKDRNVAIEYRFAIPNDETLLSLEIDKVEDSNGRNLLQNQGLLIDKINKQIIEEYGENSGHLQVGPQLKKGYVKKRDDSDSNDSIQYYDITFVFYDLVYPMEYINIEGKIRTDSKSYPSINGINTVAFSKTISLSLSDNQSTDTFVNLDVLKPSSVWYSDMGYSFNSAGLGANFLIPSESKIQFVDIVQDKSNVDYLQDSKGTDLIKMHKSIFKDRVKYLKSSRTNYGFDSYDDINKEIGVSCYNQRLPNLKINFNINSYTLPNSNQIDGKVTMKLLGFEESSKSKIEKFEIENLSTNLDFKINDEIFIYEKDSWNATDKNKKKYSKFKKYDYSKLIHIKSIKAYDSDENLISIPQGDDYRDINLDTRFICILEDTQGPITLEVEYYELNEYDREYQLAILFDLE